MANPPASHAIGNFSSLINISLLQKLSSQISPIYYCVLQLPNTRPPHARRVLVIDDYGHLKATEGPTAAANNRPISLPNLNATIFMAILAYRLTILLPVLIHRDQVGFIPERDATYDVKKKSLILFSLQCTNDQKRPLIASRQTTSYSQ